MNGQVEARVIPFEIEKIKRYQAIPNASEQEVQEMVRGVNLREDEFAQIKNILIESKALLKGAFILRSGGHSSWFMQFVRVAQHPNNIKYIANLIIDRFSGTDINTILSPNSAGTLLGVRIAHLRECRFIQCNIDKEEPELRRGLEIDKDDRILAVNDIATTGRGIRELQKVAGKGVLVGLATFACRYSYGYESLRDSFLPVRYESLITLDMDYYTKDNCPLCKQGIEHIQADELW